MKFYISKSSTDFRVKCDGYANTTGSTEKAEATAADSDPDDYINMTTEANATVNESQAATYMELTSSNQASPSVYASINIAEKMIAMPKTTSPVYENMADL